MEATERMALRVIQQKARERGLPDDSIRRHPPLLNETGDIRGSYTLPENGGEWGIGWIPKAEAPQ